MSLIFWNQKIKLNGCSKQAKSNWEAQRASNEDRDDYFLARDRKHKEWEYVENQSLLPASRRIRSLIQIVAFDPNTVDRYVTSYGLENRCLTSTFVLTLPEKNYFILGYSGIKWTISHGIQFSGTGPNSNPHITYKDHTGAESHFVIKLYINKQLVTLQKLQKMDGNLYGNCVYRYNTPMGPKKQVNWSQVNGTNGTYTITFEDIRKIYEQNRIWIKKVYLQDARS
jgi:hypothetical protein